MADSEKPDALAGKMTGAKLEGIQSPIKSLIPEISSTEKHQIYSLDACWFTLAEIEQEPMPLLLDTGANTNVLSVNVYKNLIKEKVGLEDSEQQLFGANGESIGVKGAVTCKTEIGGEEFAVKYIVAELPGVPGILGMEFLSKNQCSLELGEGILKCRDIQVDLVKIPNGEELRVEGASLPPRRVVRIKVQAGREAMAWAPYEALLDSLGVMVSNRELVSGDSDTSTTVNVINVGERDVRLLPEMVIGRVEPIESKRNDNYTDKIEPLIEDPLDYLRPLVEASIAHVPLEEQGRVKDLILSNAELFAKDDNDLGETDLIEHSIPMGQAAPIQQPMRRMAPTHREIVDQEVKNMLAAGVIVESSSSWSSPIVLVKKKNSTKLRFCVDYRALNEVTEKDSYSLANIQDCLDALHGSKFYGVMDMASGYWQVPIKPEDRCKTAFPARSGHFEFRKMAFGLCNAPASFQRLVEKVFRGLQWKTVLAYLDDIVVFGRTLEETIQRLQEVFDRLKMAGLKLKPSKCKFFQPEVTYLGHIISEGGIA